MIGLKRRLILMLKVNLGMFLVNRFKMSWKTLEGFWINFRLNSLLLMMELVLKRLVKMSRFSCSMEKLRIFWAS
jgi:hypothetical protein